MGRGRVGSGLLKRRHVVYLEGFCLRNESKAQYDLIVRIEVPLWSSSTPCFWFGVVGCREAWLDAMWGDIREHPAEYNLILTRPSQV